MSKKQLTTGKVVPQTFDPKDRRKARRILGSDRYSEGEKTLLHGEKFELTYFERFKLSSIKPNVDKLSPMSTISLFSATLGMVISILAEFKMGTLLTESILFNAIFAFGFMFVGIGIAPFYWRNKLEVTQADHTFPEMRQIHITLNDLANNAVWKNTTQYPLVNRFDIEKVRQNAEDMATEIDYRVYNIGVKPEECENFSKLTELLKNLKQVFANVKTMEAKYKEYEARNSAELHEIRRAELTAKVEKVLEKQKVVDVANAVVSESLQQNDLTLKAITSTIE